MNIKEYFNGLVNRKVGWVFLSSLITKVSAAALSVIVLRFLTVEEFGVLTLYKNVFIFFAPMIGVGLSISFLRLAPKIESNQQKQLFLLSSMIVGTIFSTLTFFLFYLIARNILDGNFDQTIFFTAFVLAVLFFNYDLLINYFRVNHRNDAFSKLNIVLTIIVFAIVIPTVYFERTAHSFFKGQIVALIIIILFFLFAYWRTLVTVLKVFKLRNFIINIRYGIYVSIGACISQLMLSADNLMLAHLGTSMASLGVYGACSLIFTSLLFLPAILMVTDFVHISGLQRNSLISYLIGYWKMCSIIIICLLVPLGIFSSFFLENIFGKEYRSGSLSLSILMIGAIFSFLFRIPAGNILNALGYAKFNLLISIPALVLFILISLYTIPQYGIAGAAFSTTFTISLTSLVSFYFMFKVVK